ncbi:transposase [Candidatus Sumerlaeota bacterium]|nr:transposase [Candidatus Sumerlaeota bacterium]
MAPVDVVLKDFLAHFQHVFTAPSFLLFEMIIYTYLSRLCVDASLVQVWRWRDTIKHWTNLHRFVKVYKWSAILVANALLSGLIRRFDLKELYFVADSTDVERYSKKLPAVFKLWNTKLRRYVFSQRWMVAGILIPTSPDLSQFMCCGLLPLLWNKTKKITELLVEGLSGLEFPDSIRPYLVVDAFLSSVIPDGWHIVTRLKSNAALFDPPPAFRRKGQKGPNPKKGKQRNALRTFYCARDKMILDYRGQKVRVVARKWRVRQWKYKPALILICQLVNHTNWKPIILGTTDTEMDPQKLLNLYAARLDIEALFQDVKTKSGFGKYRGKKKEAHEKVAQLVLVSYTLKQMLLSIPGFSDVNQKEPWYKGRKDGKKTTGQLRRLMGAKFLSDLFMQFVSKDMKLDKLDHVKEQIFRKIAQIL